jgi:PST family polysaccharide transporter
VVALSTIPFAQLLIQMRFRTIAGLSVFTTTLDMALRVLLAWLGCGAFSLALPLVISALARTCFLWAIAPARVRLNPALDQWKHLIGDSSRLTAATFCGQVVRQGDYLILGMLASEAVVGLYFFAFNLSMVSFYLFAEGLVHVLYPALTSLQYDTARQANAFLRAAKVLTAIVIPVCLVQSAVAAPFVRFVFDPKWEPAIPLVQWLSIGMALRSVGVPAMLLLRSQGRFGTYMVLNLVFVLLFFPLATIGLLTGGVVGLAAFVALYYILESLLYGYAALSFAGKSWRDLVGIFIAPILGSATAISLALLLLHTAKPMAAGSAWDMLSCLFIGSASFVGYVAFLHVFAGQLLSDVIANVLRRIAPRTVSQE